MPRAAFDSARLQNADGIGIMSPRGVSKFYGKKHGKRAWRELRALAAEGLPHGVHFRFATHGDISKAQLHPFRTQSGAHVMHNGVIWETAGDATGAESDTSLYVSKYMRRAPEPTARHYDAYYSAVEADIGFSNKLLVMHVTGGEFTICNEDAGEWLNGIWYSNLYSLPAAMAPRSFDWRLETTRTADLRSCITSKIGVCYSRPLRCQYGRFIRPWVWFKHDVHERAADGSGE
jgi:predicted glutamine amidotransferase